MVAAIAGPLLSSDFMRQAQSTAEALTPPRIARYRVLRAQACQTLGPATHPAAILPVAIRPLAAWLGWPAIQDGGRSVPEGLWWPLVAAGTDVVGLLVTAHGHASSADRLAVRLAITEGTRWAITSDGHVLRLIDGMRGESRGYLEFDLDGCADDTQSLAWLARLLGPPAFTAGADSHVIGWLAQSDAFGRRVCDALRGGVSDALETFTEAVAGAPGRRRELHACYGEALTAVYRVLFLLFAEARQLVPMWHPVYRRGYSVDALRTRLIERRSPKGTWAALQAIARLAHAGGEAGDLRVTPFNGRLFAPSRAPLLDHLALDDAGVGRALDALCFTRSSDRAGRQRIAYGELGVEELGSVYENLLDQEPARAGPGASRRSTSVIRLRQSASAARKSTGTFYTPRAIADALVRETLMPLTAGKRPDDILALRVLDPAMGSGAFLVSTSRFLALEWERALIASGDATASDLSDADRAAARRVIASRCLFGVDRNPMAVQLAQLSVWLATLSADRPLSFLDHHLVAGNSLVGASPLDVLTRPPGRESRREPLPLDALFEWSSALTSIRGGRERIEQTPDDTAGAVHAKEAALAELARDAGLARWKAACDLWCVAWMPPPVDRALYHALLDLVLGRAGITSPAIEDARKALADRARAMGCFNWPLEFPEVFLDPDGRPRSDGGFDAVVGNPPWEMLRADRGRAAGAYDEGNALVRFGRDSGVYRHQGRGHANQFQLFVERAVQLARPGGRIGLIVPSTLLTDEGSESLRRALLLGNQVDAITVFDNRRGLFPIHRSVRFATITIGRHGQTSAIRCRFGVTDAMDTTEARSVRSDSSPQVTLTPGLLERVSGPGLAVPDLPTPRDLRIVESLSTTHPRLADASGWHVTFSRELNATDDRDCFRRGPPRRDDLPVIEGRHLAPFRVQMSNVTRHADRLRARARLGARDAVERPRLAYRDVAGWSNRMTLIAAVLPRGVVTVHTVFCLREHLPLDAQQVLCALLNSFVANYLVRRRVTTHVTAGIIAALPVPKAAEWFEELADLAATLQVSANPVAAARVQALAAEAYGLSADDLQHILDTFPLVPRAERDAVHHAFVSRRPRESCR